MALFEMNDVFKWTEKFRYTVKPVNKGHPRERPHMVFIDKWSSFGGYFVLFN